MSKIDLATFTGLDSWVGGRVEVEVEGELIGIESLADDIEALNCVGGRQELANNVGWSGWVGLSCCDTENTGGQSGRGTAGTASHSSVGRRSLAGIKRRSIGDRGSEAGKKN